MEQNDDLCIEEAGSVDEETFKNLLNDTSTDFPDAKAKSARDYKVDKFKALYQCRYILAEHGTMQERRICKNQLERMKKLGIKSV